MNGVYQFIINHFPPHRVYVEGYLGSGIIMQQKRPADVNIGIDRDAAVIDRFNCVDHQDGYNYYAGGFIETYRKIQANLTITAKEDILIYLDPPYLIDTRSYGKRYKHDMTTIDHIELLDYISSLPGQIVISAYENLLYDRLLTGWNKDTIKSFTHGKIRFETIYYNYNITRVQTTKHYGNNCSDRQRIKRKVQRLIAKMQGLPEIERQLLIDELCLKYRP